MRARQLGLYRGVGERLRVGLGALVLLGGAGAVAAVRRTEAAASAGTARRLRRRRRLRAVPGGEARQVVRVLARDEGSFRVK